MNHPWRVGTKNVLCFWACYVLTAPHVVAWCLLSLPFVKLPGSPQKCKPAAEWMGKSPFVGHGGEFSPPCLLVCLQMSNEVNWGQARFVPQFGQMCRASGKHSCLVQVAALAKSTKCSTEMCHQGAQRTPLAIRKSACNESFQPCGHLKWLSPSTTTQHLKAA